MAFGTLTMCFQNWVHIARLRLKGGNLTQHQDQWPWWNLEVWQDACRRMPYGFALPSTAVASMWFWMYFCHPWNASDNFFQWNFLFWWLFFGTQRDRQTGGQTYKQTDRQTDIGTDRLFSENIILDVLSFRTGFWKCFEMQKWPWFLKFSFERVWKALRKLCRSFWKFVWKFVWKLPWPPLFKSLQAYANSFL